MDEVAVSRPLLLAPLPSSEILMLRPRLVVAGFLLGVLTLSLSAQSCPAPFPSLSSCGQGTPVTSVQLGDAQLGLELTTGAEGLGIHSLTEAGVGTLAFEDAGLFALHLMENGVGGTVRPIDFADIRCLQFGSSTFLSFRDAFGGQVPVSVIVRIWEDDGAYEFDILVHNRSRSAALESVDFPIMRPQPISGPDPAGDALVTPFMGGASIVATTFQPTLVFPAPSNTSMQMWTLYDRLGQRALYWQTKDGLGFRKDYIIEGRVTSTEAKVKQYPINGNRAGNDYISPYSTTLTAFAGNWYDGALRYRRWALGQRWAGRGKLTESTEFSSLVQTLQAHVLQYPNHLAPFDDFGSLVDDAERLQQRLGLGADEMALLWSDWNGKLFNVELPDFNTMRPSVPGAVDQAHQSGLCVLPYIHVDLWSEVGDATQAFDATQWAWTLADGTVPLELVGPSDTQLDRPHFRIDSTFRGARDAKDAVIADALSLFTNGQQWNGAYLDTWSGKAPEINFNRNLGWLKGGTPFWELGRSAEGRQFKNTIEQGTSGGFFVSEMPNETTLDRLDLVYYNPFTLGTVQLPVWETVYHGYQLSSNLEATVPETPALVPSMLATMHYDYHLGKVFGFSNFFADTRNLVDPDPGGDALEPIYAFVSSALALEDCARRFRIEGERLRPLSASIERDIETLEYFFVGPPPAAASIWRAENGDLGILVTNASPATQLVTLEVDFATYGLSGPQTIYQCAAGGVRFPLLPVSGSFSIPVPVPPATTLVFEIIAD